MNKNSLNDTQDMILKVSKLSKFFGGLHAVENVDINMKRGTIHALIGPNGAGKTTTLSMINGTLRPTSGSIAFNGREISNLETNRIARMGVARTFQNIKLFSSMTVLENIMVGGHSLYTKGSILRFLFNIRESNRLEREMREKAEEIARFIGVYELKDQVLGNIAYGRQKVTELGRAMMLDPKLILLDEPAAGLNPAERAEFIDILQKIHEKGTDLFLIEHNMDVVMSISDQITVLNFGRKIAEGVPSEIQHNTDVIKAYLGEEYEVVS